MTEEVYQCFKKLINKRRKTKVEPMVDGVGGFLVLDKNGMPYLALHWEKGLSMLWGSITEHSKKNCRQSRPMCVGIPIAVTWQSRE